MGGGGDEKEDGEVLGVGAGLKGPQAEGKGVRECSVEGRGAAAW